MTEVTGRLRWDGRHLYLGNLWIGEIEKDARRSRYMDLDPIGTFSVHDTEQAARDALFARVLAAITEGTP